MQVAPSRASNACAPTLAPRRRLSTLRAAIAGVSMPSTTHLHRAALLVGTVALLLIASGCGYRPGRGPARVDPKTGTPPIWYTSPPLDTRLVHGVGAAAGHDREAAVAEARKDLARQLHIIIDSDGDEVDEPGGTATQRPATLSLASTDLPGVKITRMEQTEDAIFVLLSFDRAAWADSLRNRIRHVDGRIRDALTNPAPGRTTVAGAALRHQLLRPLVAERDDLYARLLVAEPGTVIAPATLTAERLRNDLAQACNGLVVDLAISSDLEAIERDLVGALATLGLRVRPGAETANLHVDLGLAIDQRTVDGMDRAEGTLTVTVRRGDRQALGSLSVQIRASSSSASIARDRLLGKLAERWREYLDDGFVDCLTRY